LSRKRSDFPPSGESTVTEVETEEPGRPEAEAALKEITGAGFKPGVGSSGLQEKVDTANPATTSE
jgi:hypothetical protein